VLALLGADGRMSWSLPGGVLIQLGDSEGGALLAD
jgi:hypothetical protein